MKRFLLLSDIHASDVDPSSSGAPSYVSSVSAAMAGKVDPLTELEKLFSRPEDRPDYILCAGDMTNRSDPGSFTYIWQRLNNLATAMNAKLITTVGNHDLDSRYNANRFDPRGYAMALSPSIPVPDRSRFLEYWAENFTILSEPDCNIVVLNTAAYHGGGVQVADELEHGRVSALTLSRLREAIATMPSAQTNLLLCHHHPLKAEQGDQELAGQTRGGERLVEMLGSSAYPWIIVHGHKHTPDLFYGHGSSNAPVVVGCASFSSQVNADAQNKNPNQVHLLVSDPGAAANHGLTLAGNVLSWTWVPGVTWEKAKGSHGLPHYSGFGYRGSVRVLATRLEQALSGSSANHLSWKEAVAAVPETAHLTPPDFVALERELASLKLTLLQDRDGSVAQIGRAS